MRIAFTEFIIVSALLIAFISTPNMDEEFLFIYQIVLRQWLCILHASLINNMCILVALMLLFVLLLFETPSKCWKKGQ